MRVINQRRGLSIWQWLALLLAAMLLVGGLYIAALVMAPAVAPRFSDPIDIAKVEPASVGDDRIIIPKIGVNIAYGTNGEASLDEGAWWRYPDRGNPAEGGNFIIAAHRFTLHNSITETIEKSPFYNVGQLMTGDQIFVDYEGKRYLYEVDKTYTVLPSQTEIEAPSETAKLTLYTCSLGGESDGRVVVNGKLLGEVAKVTSSRYN